MKRTCYRCARLLPPVPTALRGAETDYCADCEQAELADPLAEEPQTADQLAAALEALLQGSGLVRATDPARRDGNGANVPVAGFNGQRYLVIVTEVG